MTQKFFAAAVLFATLALVSRAGAEQVNFGFSGAVSGSGALTFGSDTVPNDPYGATRFLASAGCFPMQT